MASTTLLSNPELLRRRRLTAHGNQKRKPRIRWREKLAVLAPGLLPADAEKRLESFRNIFGYRRTGAIVTRVGQGPRAWTTKPGPLTIEEIARHLLGDAMPGLRPVWVGTRSLSTSCYFCLDVDSDRCEATAQPPFRPRKPGCFQDRLEQAYQALRSLGVDPSDRGQVLTLRTPSGGRHIYVFFDRPYFLDQYQDLLKSAGLRFAKGGIEFFPSERQGLRLPFGYIPDAPHDPTAWLRFLRRFRSNRIKRFRLDELFEALERSQVQGGTDERPGPERATVAPTFRCPTSAVASAMADVVLPHGTDASEQSLSATSINDVQRLLSQGIAANGTRTAILKVLAAHFIFVRGLSAEQAANILVQWALNPRHVSRDIHRDLAEGTKTVSDHIQRMCSWYQSHRRTGAKSPSPPRSAEALFSGDEIDWLKEKLRSLAAQARVELADFLLSFLRFAKGHGQPIDDGSGWRAAPAVNAVIRKWPGCHHMGYKQRIESAAKLGLFRLHREKWQNPNGPGRARTYDLLLPCSSAPVSLSFQQARDAILNTAIGEEGKEASQKATSPTVRVFKEELNYADNRMRRNDRPAFASQGRRNPTAIRSPRTREFMAEAAYRGPRKSHQPPELRCGLAASIRTDIAVSRLMTNSHFISLLNTGTNFMREASAILPPVQFNSMGPDAPVAWYGGKYYLARWIIEQLPAHRVYVEPFGGMANVLLKKQPSEVEVFNDLDGRVVNLFRVLRDRNQFEELKRLAELTPYSRQQFAELCDTPEPESAVEKAFWFFVRCRQARGGIGMSNINANAWATSTRIRRSMPEPISKYLSALDGLDAVAGRFRRVLVEALPAIDLIKKYDGPDVLFYCDPPYLAATRSGGRAATYHVEMSERDHKDLLDVLGRCEAKVVLSGYASEMYDTSLAGWTRIERPMKVQFSNSGGDRVEVLWIKQ